MPDSPVDGLPPSRSGASTQLDPEPRSLLLQALAQALALSNKSAPTLLPDIAEALVLDIPTVYRRAALDLLHTVARQFPAGAAAMLRSLPVAYEEVGHKAVTRWTRRGLLIAADSAKAGVAYFGLRSRTSLNVLRAIPTAASRLLKKGLLASGAQRTPSQRRFGHVRAFRGCSGRNKKQHHPSRDTERHKRSQSP